MTVYRYRVSLWNDEYFLELGNGDDYITLWIC